MVRATAKIFVAFALSASLALGNVGVWHEEQADFGAYRTYAWREGTPAARPDVQQWIVDSIDRELQDKGLRQVEGGADAYVSTVAYGKMDVAQRGNYVRLNGGWGVITNHVVDSTTGYLIVDLIDAASDEAVWRGVAEKVFQSSDVNKAQKKIEKKQAKATEDQPAPEPPTPSQPTPAERSAAAAERQVHLQRFRVIIAIMTGLVALAALLVALDVIP